MILDPINDRECLDQLTVMARELAGTTLIRTVAAHLGSREAVIKWFQSLPQTDDFGDEQIRFIKCDVPQRVRLLPDDPNCVERSMAALMLLEAIAPATPRALATVDKPQRHTGLVEKYEEHWRAVDLFPRRKMRRNLDWGEFSKDALQGIHNYVGKPVLKFYLGDTGGKVADAIGDQEDKWIGREKKQPEKKDAPPPDGAQRPAAPTKQAASIAAGAGAPKAQPSPERGGGKNGEKSKSTSGPGVAPGHGAASADQTHDGESGDPHHEGTNAQRWWWLHGW